MPPRRRGGAPAPLGVAPAAAGALAPVGAGAARPSLVAALREARAWAEENVAASAALVALALLALALMLPPSVASIVARALASRPRVELPVLPRLVERREMAAVVDVVERGDDYVVVDGGNRVGKSIAVRVAASRLSATRTVLWSKCLERDTAAIVLQKLLGLDAPATTLSRVISGAAKLSPPKPPEVEDIENMVLLAKASGPEPVFVVEMAERLSVTELKTLLDVAKELVDASRGRFVFVFSPTEKLGAIRSFGSLSRATVIHVGDLQESEALSFLARSGCGEAHAHALYALVGGHLPHLASAEVQGACLGTVSASDAAQLLHEGIGMQLKEVDRVLRAAGAACAGLCDVAADALSTPAVIEALVKEHLAVATLRKGVLVESRLVLAHANATCSCPGG